MCADRSRHPIVHFVGSIPLPDSEIVFRTLSSAVGPHLKRVPDGETGIRKTWIRFLQWRSTRARGGFSQEIGPNRARALVSESVTSGLMRGGQYVAGDPETERRIGEDQRPAARGWKG
jgi:hypothetical protein